MTAPSKRACVVCGARVCVEVGFPEDDPRHGLCMNRIYRNANVKVTTRRPDFNYRKDPAGGWMVVGPGAYLHGTVKKDPHTPVDVTRWIGIALDSKEEIDAPDRETAAIMMIDSNEEAKQSAGSSA